MGDDDDGLNKAKHADIDEENPSVEDRYGEDATEDKIHPALQAGIKYKPHFRVPDSQVFEVVHRIAAARRLDKRSGDRYKRVVDFMNCSKLRKKDESCLIVLQSVGKIL